MKRIMLIGIFVIMLMCVLSVANASSLNSEMAEKLLTIIGYEQMFGMIENENITKRVFKPETQDDPFEYYYIQGENSNDILKNSVSLHYMLTKQNLDHLKKYPDNIMMLIVEFVQVSDILYEREGNTLLNIERFYKLLETGENPYVNALTYAKVGGRLEADALYDWEICPFVLASETSESVDGKLYLYIRMNKNIGNGKIAWYEMILADEEKVGSLTECLISARNLNDARAKELRRFK